MAEGEGTQEGQLNLEANEGEGTEGKSIVVDGKTYTEKEIIELQRKETDLLRDYHKKTEGLAVDREALKGKEKEASDKLEEAQSLLANIQKAQSTDVNFYTTHEAKEWDGYESEIDRLSERGGKSRKTQGAEIPKEVMDKIGNLEKEVQSLKADTAGDKADATVKMAETLCSKKYPLADLDAVKDRMYVFYSREKRLPTEGEVKKMVETSHERVASLGLVERGSGKSGSGLPPSGGGAPPEMPKDIPSGVDLDSDAKAGESFFKIQKARRETG